MAQSAEQCAKSKSCAVSLSGQPVTVEVPNSQDATVLHGLKPGAEIDIYSVHLPEDGIETFNASKRNYIVPIFERMLDKSKFIEGKLAGDNTTNSGNRPLPLIWNNNYWDIWVADIIRGSMPQYFTINLGVTAYLSRLVFFTREFFPYELNNIRLFNVWEIDVLTRPIARLKIKVTCDENIALTASDFDDMTMSITGMYTEADFQLASGEFTGFREFKEIVPYKTGSGADDASFEALVFPGSGSDGVTFVFNVVGRRYLCKIPVNFESDKCYEYEFKLDKILVLANTEQHFDSQASQRELAVNALFTNDIF